MYILYIYIFFLIIFIYFFFFIFFFVKQTGNNCSILFSRHLGVKHCKRHLSHGFENNKVKLHLALLKDLLNHALHSFSESLLICFVEGTEALLSRYHFSEHITTFVP